MTEFTLTFDPGSRLGQGPGSEGGVEAAGRVQFAFSLTSSQSPGDGIERERPPSPALRSLRSHLPQPRPAPTSLFSRGAPCSPSPALLCSSCSFRAKSC